MGLIPGANVSLVVALACVAFYGHVEAQQRPTPNPTGTCKLQYAPDDLVTKLYANRDAGGAGYRLSKDGKILTVSRSVGSARVLRQYDFGAMSFKERSYPSRSYVGDAADCLNVCDINAREVQEAAQWISHHLYAFNDQSAATALNNLQSYVKLMPGAEFTVNAFRNGLIVGSLSYKNYGRCGAKTEEITATSYVGDESVTLDFASKTFTWRMFRGARDYEKVVGAADLKVLNDAMKTYMVAFVQGLKINLSKNTAVTSAYNHENQAVDELLRKISEFTPSGKPGSWGSAPPYLPGGSLRNFENKQPAVFWPNMPSNVAEAKHWPAR